MLLSPMIFLHPNSLVYTPAGLCFCISQVHNLYDRDVSELIQWFHGEVPGRTHGSSYDLNASCFLPVMLYMYM